MGAGVADQYSSGTLWAAVLAALEAEGQDPDTIDPDALATFEDFHTLGRLATATLAELVDPQEGERVLDLGSGIGGPARHLARAHGCWVTGIDLTPELCEVARELNRRTGLDSRVTIDVGDVTDLPYDALAFDVVWTQHVAMNVADKAAMYDEAARVLLPDGRLALFDIVAGHEGAQPTYPVPWADDPSRSHLVTADEVRRLVEAAGFSITVDEEPTDEAAAFFRSLAGAEPPGGALNVGLLIPGFPEKAANLAAGFEDGRLGLLRLVAEV